MSWRALEGARLALGRREFTVERMLYHAAHLVLTVASFAAFAMLAITLAAILH